jgi:hypothetical protein
MTVKAKWLFLLVLIVSNIATGYVVQRNARPKDDRQRDMVNALARMAASTARSLSSSAIASRKTLDAVVKILAIDSPPRASPIFCLARQERAGATLT